MAVYRRGQFYVYDFIFMLKNGSSRLRHQTKSRTPLGRGRGSQTRIRKIQQICWVIGVECFLRRTPHQGPSATLIKTHQPLSSLAHQPPFISLWRDASLLNVKRLIGGKLLPDLTEEGIRDYMAARKAEDGQKIDGRTVRVSGRTINMELGELERYAMERKWSGSVAEGPQDGRA